MTPPRCEFCSMSGINCDKPVLASVPVPDSFTFYNLDTMTCREANHNNYDYRFTDERVLEEMNEAMIKAGRKPETDGLRKQKDQGEGVDE